MAKKTKQKNGGNLELIRKTQELETLWDISQSLYQHLNINDLILHIINRVREVMDVEAVSVILQAAGTDELIFCWAENEPSEIATRLREIRFPIQYGIAGSVFTSGQPELVLNSEKDSRHYKAVDYITGFKTKSMIAVPLKKKEKTIGVLEVLNKKKGSFNDHDLTFLTILTPIIAMALDNARMYGEMDRAYNDLKIADKVKNHFIEHTQQENNRLRQEITRQYRFDNIAGNSDRILKVFQLCEKAIQSDITVLVQGETGTGKELIARCIHYNGPRKLKPFVTQNCGAIPETLLTSELFGHKRGAFTGAYSDKKGLFEIAIGGTVFLDEVADMSPAMQTSLLRVLQEGEIKPLGADQPKKVDVRVISATNRNLEEDVKKGRFREDLLYRINVFTINLPPLRDRTGDIPVLANNFISKFDQKANKSIMGLNNDAIQCLMAYAFPGNVRELENEIERAVAMAEHGNFIEIRHLSEKFQKKQGLVDPGSGVRGTLKEKVETLERMALCETLEKHKGNKSVAAKELGLSRYGLMKKMQRYGL